MATAKEYRDYVLECLTRAGNVTVRAMMGEYCLYCDGKVIGLLCDDTLYLKQTETSNKLLPDAERGYPYDGSKTLMLIVEDFEDTERMAEILRAMPDELPEPKPKKRRMRAMEN